MYSTVTYSIGAIVLCYSKEKRNRENRARNQIEYRTRKERNEKGLLVIHIDSKS